MVQGIVLKVNETVLDIQALAPACDGPARTSAPTRRFSVS